MNTFLLFVGVVSCTSAGNVFLKLASLRLPPDASVSERLFSPYTLLGLSLFGAGVLFYITALGSLPLSKAQSFASAQFICTILAAFVVFRDQISVEQWIGMILIAIGIALVGIK